MTQDASIAGEKILLRGSIRWRLKAGTAPHSAAFPMHRDAVTRVIAASRGLRPVILQLDDIRIEKLYITGTRPAPHPQMINVVLSDLRYFWSYPHIGPRRYNIRRRSGDRRWLDGAMVRIERIADDIDYAVWSLNGGSPWSATEMVDDVFQALQESLQDSVPFSVDSFVGINQMTPPDGVEINGPGDRAVSRALGFLPGASVYITPSGHVRAIDSLDASDLDIVASETWRGDKL